MKRILNILALTLVMSALAENACSGQDSYGWLYGGWTDGTVIYTFTPNTITATEDGKTKNVATYYIGSDEYVDTDWKFNNKYAQSFYVSRTRRSLSIEGSNCHVYKILKYDPSKSILDMLVQSSEAYAKPIDWAYGVWRSMYGNSAVEITPEYIKGLIVPERNGYRADLDDAVQKSYKPRKIKHSALGEVIQVGDFYLDEKSKQVFCVHNLDRREYLQKTKSPTPKKDNAFSRFISDAGRQETSGIAGYEFALGSWSDTNWGGNACTVLELGLDQFKAVAPGIINDDVEGSMAALKPSAYRIEIVHNDYLGDLKQITPVEDNDLWYPYYIDEKAKSIFYIYDYDCKMYLKNK